MQTLGQNFPNSHQVARALSGFILFKRFGNNWPITRTYQNLLLKTYYFWIK